MLRKMGRSRSFARASASGPQGDQSTGLLACWSRYGLVSVASRLGMLLDGTREGERRPRVAWVIPRARVRAPGDRGGDGRAAPRLSLAGSGAGRPRWRRAGRSPALLGWFG